MSSEGMAMQDQEQRKRFILFGDYQFDRQTRELLRDGRRIPLQLQPSHVLKLLIENAGEIVTRAQLREQVWPSTITVDFDHGLNNAIARLRQALEDSPGKPRFIETIPRVGYRFTHPLRELGSEHQPRRASRLKASGRMWPGVGIVVTCIAGALIAVHLQSDENQSGNRATTNAEPGSTSDARDAYLRGLDLYEQRNKEALRLGIDYLKQATELDPEFAPAWAALAMAYTTAGGNTLVQYTTPADVYPSAIAAVERALQLDPQLGQAHLALAFAMNQLQPASAANDVAIEQSFRRARELAPADSNGSLLYGNFLASRGRGDDALVEFRRALELNPLSPSINSRLGTALIGQGRYEEGMAYLQKTVELDPWQYNARLRLGWGYIATGDLDAAREAFESAERISPNSVRSLAGLAYVAARQGDVHRARQLLAAVLPMAESLDDPFEIAIIYVGLGDRDNAIEWLARTASQSRTLHRPGPWGIAAPIYDWLRDDARFIAIEREVTGLTRPVASNSPTL